MNFPRRRFLQSGACFPLFLHSKLLPAQNTDLQAFASALLFALVPNRDVPASLYETQASHWPGYLTIHGAPPERRLQIFFILIFSRLRT